jgi:hypothetical protein
MVSLDHLLEYVIIAACGPRWLTRKPGLLDEGCSIDKSRHCGCTLSPHQTYHLCSHNRDATGSVNQWHQNKRMVRAGLRLRCFQTCLLLTNPPHAQVPVCVLHLASLFHNGNMPPGQSLLYLDPTVTCSHSAQCCLHIWTPCYTIIVAAPAIIDICPLKTACDQTIKTILPHPIRQLCIAQP